MEPADPIISLTLFTLIAGIVIAGGAFLFFLRSRKNRHSAEQALLGEGHHRQGPAPDGALPELIGVLVLALIVMAMLAMGYSSR